MKEIEIAGRKVSINIDAVAEGLHELHAEDPNKKAILAFGMLDAGIMEQASKDLNELIKSKFSAEANEIFAGRIKEFIKDCEHKIAVGIYQRAKMVV